MRVFRTALKPLLMAFMALSLTSACDGPNGAEHVDVPEHIFLAVSNLYRNADDRARDDRQRPDEILAFYGLEKGMSVYEVGAGSGYYTDLLSLTVGKNGQVFPQYSKERWNNTKAEFSSRFSSRSNIVPYIGQKERLKLGDASVDMVMVASLWHRMHYEGAAGEKLPDVTQAFLENSLRLLKPGGVFAIIEHEAAPGTSRAQAAKWYRSTKQMTIDDVEAAGFEFVAASNLLANPKDDLENDWRIEFDERDMSQRFVLKFTKPKMSGPKMSGPKASG